MLLTFYQKERIWSKAINLQSSSHRLVGMVFDFSRSNKSRAQAGKSRWDLNSRYFEDLIAKQCVNNVSLIYIKIHSQFPFLFVSNSRFPPLYWPSTNNNSRPFLKFVFKFLFHSWVSHGEQKKIDHIRIA